MALEQRQFAWRQRGATIRTIDSAVT